jgi:hypothetical protein
VRGGLIFVRSRDNILNLPVPASRCSVDKRGGLPSPCVCLYNNLKQGQAPALRTDSAVKAVRPDDWRGIHDPCAESLPVEYAVTPRFAGRRICAGFRHSMLSYSRGKHLRKTLRAVEDSIDLDDVFADAIDRQPGKI